MLHLSPAPYKHVVTAKNLQSNQKRTKTAELSLASSCMYISNSSASLQWQKNYEGK